MKTFRNNRSGQEIQSDLTHQQACELLAQGEGSNDSHWLWFWIHKVAKEHQGLEAHPNGTLDHPHAAIQFLADAFTYAIGRGLKNPMIRAHFGMQRFKVYLSRRGTLCLKSGRLVENAEKGCKDPEGDEEYVGCWLRNRFYQGKLGSFDQDDSRRPLRPLTPTEQQFLDKLAADPVGFLAQCSKDMDRCCYCNSALEDPTSKLVGYGPICAKRWGLPWSKGCDRKWLENAPSFAKLHCQQASDFCDAIRADVHNVQLWAVFSDWCEERGLLKVEAPKKGAKTVRGDSGGGRVERCQYISRPLTEPETKETPEAEQDCHMGRCPAPWTLGSNGTYAADMSDLPKVKPCPKCGQTIGKAHLTATDRSYDEVTGYRFNHPCGAKLLIIND